MFLKGADMKDILIIGNSVVDVLAGPVPHGLFDTGSVPVKNMRLTYGGDGLNQAVNLARWGARTDLITKTGTDEAGRKLLAFVSEKGVGTSHFITEDGLTTSMNIVLVDENGERFFITDPESSQRKLSKDDILGALRKAYKERRGNTGATGKDRRDDVRESRDIVSFAGLFVSHALSLSDTEDIFAFIKQQRPETILAVDMTKAKNGERIEDLRGILKYTDYIFPNADEAALLTGIKDPVKNAGIFLDYGAKCAIIKCGKSGSIIRTKDGLLRIPAYSDTNCIDTTGAGDSYVAGFLRALSEGYTLKDCGLFASAAASLIVEHIGATDDSDTIEKVRERFREIGDQNV